MLGVQDSNLRWVYCIPISESKSDVFNHSTNSQYSSADRTRICIHVHHASWSQARSETNYRLLRYISKKSFIWGLALNRTEIPCATSTSIKPLSYESHIRTPCRTRIDNLMIQIICSTELS